MGRGGGSGGGHRGGGGHFHYGSSRGGSSSSSSRKFNSYGSYYSNSVWYRNDVYGRTRWSSTVNTIVTIIFIVFIILCLLSPSCSGSSIQKSTHEREPLPSSQCTVVDSWYVDELGWISDSSELKRGLKYFYDETGVQPLLYITDNINGDTRPSDADFENALNKMYDEYFDDEGHIILCFMESSPSIYATYYVAGNDAKTVVDSEAGEIILDYLDYNYTNDSLSDEEFFSMSFEQAADRMMTVSKSIKQYMIYAVIAFILVCGSIAIAVFVRKTAEEKRKQAEHDAAILKTRIDELKDPLEDKYK